MKEPVLAAPNSTTTTTSHAAGFPRAAGVLLGFSSLLMCLIPLVAPAAESPTPDLDRLPQPRLDGGRPLMRVLAERKSTREFSSQPVDRDQLASLLWAAFGVNRPETGQRTAPCTMNLRCIDIYVATAEGVCRYDAENHGLVRISRDDVRTITGGQDYVKAAPMALIYVADHAKFTKAGPAEREFYAAADAGFIGQNVYLYCASEGLGCVIHMPGDRAKISQALRLRPEQKVVLVHAVGHAAGAVSSQ